MNTSIRKSFTLLEICICIAILVFMSAFLGQMSYRAIKTHRYESGYQKLRNVILLCQKIARIENKDYTLLLENEESGLSYQILGEEKKFLKGFRCIYENEQEKIFLGFSSTGKSYPSGKLQVISLDQRFQEQIDLEKESKVFDLEVIPGKSPIDPREVQISLN